MPRWPHARESDLSILSCNKSWQYNRPFSKRCFETGPAACGVPALPLIAGDPPGSTSGVTRISSVLKYSSDRTVIISAKTGEGIEALFAKLQSYTQTSTNDASSVTITNVRHKEALVEASQALKEAQKSLQRRESAEFCAHHLRAAQEALGRIIGLDVSEELLDRIFSGFCIGK